MFRRENRRELIELLAGFVVLGLGVGLLLFGFSIAAGIAADPGGYIASQVPDTVAENASAGPRASFRFTVTDLTVDFVDESTAGDAAIVSWDWDFGDGNRTNVQSPRHVYGGNFNGFVRLTVTDGNGRESRGVGNVQAGPGVQLQGNSTVDPGDIAGGLDLGGAFAPLVNVLVGVSAVIAAFFMLVIMWLVGASITKAGWNLVRPRPETIRVRIKPKHLEAEPAYGVPVPGYGPPSQGPPPPPP